MTQLDLLLDEFEQILGDEREALRRLDRTAIEQAAERKLALDVRLKQLPIPNAASDSAVTRLTSLRRSAIENQRLLAHARACTQGVLQMLAGATLPGAGGQASKVAPRPLAVNIRG